MKQFFMILAVLALAVVLTACGDKNRNDAGGANGQTRPDTNQSQNAQQDNGTGDDALPSDTQDNARMGRSTLRRGAESTATFRQMLENGYVHDRDGFLNDGENTSW